MFPTTHSIHCRILKLTSLLILPVLFLAGANAAEVSLRFRASNWETGNPDGFSYVHKGKLVQVDSLQPSLRSDSFEYTGPSTMILYPLNATVDPPSKPIAKVKIPSGVKFPFLILVPNPDSEATLPYRALIFDDDPKKFPFPSYQIFSLSKKPVAVAVNDLKFTLDPGKKRLVTSDDKTLNLQMAVPVEEGEGWRVIYDNYFPNWKTERTLVFLLDEEVNGRNAIKTRVYLENVGMWTRSISKEDPAR